MEHQLTELHDPVLQEKAKALGLVVGIYAVFENGNLLATGSTQNIVMNECVNKMRELNHKPGIIRVIRVGLQPVATSIGPVGTKS